MGGTGRGKDRKGKGKQVEVHEEGEEGSEEEEEVIDEAAEERKIQEVSFDPSLFYDPTPHLCERYLDRDEEREKADAKGTDLRCIFSRTWRNGQKRIPNEELRSDVANMNSSLLRSYQEEPLRSLLYLPRQR